MRTIVGLQRDVHWDVSSCRLCHLDPPNGYRTDCADHQRTRTKWEQAPTNSGRADGQTINHLTNLVEDS